jgi:hypothetical protein
VNAKPPRSWAHRTGHWPLALALVAFLILSLYQLHLPGLHYDEAKEAGLNALQIARGLPVEAFRGVGVRIGGVLLPLMVQEYIGALNVYLALPFVAWLGPTAGALRLLPVLTGALTLALVYRLARAWGRPGRGVAAAAALLLAVNPSFVFWSRQGIFVTNLTALLFVASLLVARRWQQTRRPAALYALAFLWGLGLWAKLLFVWAVGAMAAWGFVALLRDRGSKADAAGIGSTQPQSGRAKPRQVLVAVVCFLAGLAPLLVFNLRTGGTVASVLGNLNTSYYGVRNAAFVANLVERLRQLVTLLRGDHLWYLGGVAANPAAPWLAGGLVACALAISLVARLRGGERRASPLPLLGVLFLLTLMVAQSSFTVSGLFITHAALFLPLIPLAGALAAGLLWRDGGKVWGIAAVVVLFAWGLGDLRATLLYHQALTRTGGHSAHSDAIYDLARYLDERGYSAPLALDWGISAPIAYLTAGRVRPVEIFGYERLDAPDDHFADRLHPFLGNPANVYILHTPEDTIFRGRRAVLEQLAAAGSGGSPREERIIAERSGRPLFVIVRVEDR